MWLLPRAPVHHATRARAGLEPRLAIFEPFARPSTVQYSDTDLGISMPPAPPALLLRTATNTKCSRFLPSHQQFPPQILQAKSLPSCFSYLLYDGSRYGWPWVRHAQMPDAPARPHPISSHSRAASGSRDHFHIDPSLETKHSDSLYISLG